ncbi:hypothetical protein SDC9_212836 [bioreactor metagenome]|uniref:Uncharacterized protein n=1 Tax=bioreactor metagenome TaxID=1076179 RepID=A0A645JNZ4_9ZZZZ
MHVGHGDSAERSVVGRLAAAFRIEGRAVEQNPESDLFRAAGKHRGGKFREKRVLVI